MHTTRHWILLTFTLTLIACAVDTGGSALSGPPDGALDGGEDAEATRPDSGPSGSGDAAVEADARLPDAPPFSLADPQPGTPEQYDLDAPASHIDQLVFALSASQGRDLNGDGRIDNAAGGLLGTINDLAEADLNQRLSEQVANGSVSLGLTWIPRGASLEHGDVELHFLHLRFTDDPARFDVYADSFLDGTRTPAVRFAGHTEGGELDAGPSTLDVVLPLFGASVELRLERTLIRGLLVQRDGGVAVTDGDLAGYLGLASVIGALNAYTGPSGQCACLGLPQGLIDPVGGLGQLRCRPPGAECGEGACQTLANLCSTVLPGVTAQADADLDGDGTRESLSVYLRFQAAPARLGGIVR